MRIKIKLAAIGCFLLAVSSIFSQQPAPISTELAEGQNLLSRLSPITSPNASADEAIFRQVGFDKAEKLLLAVATNGQELSATTEDWAAMHRAFAAIIELEIAQQHLFKASIFADLQESTYRHDEGDYVAALAAAQQGLDLQQRAGETTTLFIPWQEVASDYIHLGRIEEGVADLYKARTYIKDPTSPSAADLWSQIISIESSRGNLAIAHKESDAFLHAATANTSATFRASAQLAAANVAIEEHHYDDAATHIHNALHTIKGVPDTSTVAYQAADMLFTLGMEAIQTLPFDQAISFSEHLDKDFPGLSISISSFARGIATYRRRLSGQFDLVLRDDAAQLDSARAAKDVPAQINALLATSIDYANLRESAQEITALEEAVDLIHLSGVVISPLLRYRVLDSLGAAQLAHNDLRPARATYTEVLTNIEAITSAMTRSQLGGRYAEAQLGMAAVLEKDGDLEGARKLLQQSLNPPPNAIGHFYRSDVLFQSAKLEQSAHQPPEEVIRLYSESIAAFHDEKNISREVSARLQLVEFLLAGKKNPSAYTTLARQQLELARTASSSIGFANTVWRIQYLQGILDQITGDRANAIHAYAAAIDSLDHIRAGLSQEEERQSFVDSSAIQDLYSRQLELLTVTGDRNKAWEYLERNKARSFLEILHGRRFAAAPSSAASTSNLDNLEQQILATRIDLAPENEDRLRSSGRLPDVVRAKLVSLEADFALARQQASLSASRATQPLALRPITLAETQSRLPTNTALIEYTILDHQLAAFVVTHTSSQELHWTADTDALPGQLRRLRVQLSATQPPVGLDAQLEATSKILLAPILSTLPKTINELIIVPTQSLSSIPFQALPIAPGKLLIDRFAVAYLPSASTLQFLGFGASSSSSDLFLGALGDISVEGWPTLPGTLEETAAIQKLYPRAERVTGTAFTHDAAVKALLSHQEVHFATHGLFDEQAPLFSALLTAPTQNQSSRLSLYEIMDLNLKSRLVILSACETDRGQLSGGDEIEGLTRTFLQAGAENVVSSLWKVSDASTALLMQALHTHLRAGETTPVALRHAELEVRAKFPQPFFWAAFVDTGVR